MLYAIVLGLVQGLTEFLPVSSSGHLVVVPALLGWDEPSLGFTLLLHLGTLVAVLAYFRRDLLALAAGALGRGDDPAGSRRFIALLAVATVPAGIAGLLLQDQVESAFEKPGWVCGFWLVTAAVLVVAERIHANRDRDRLTFRGATAIGIAQAIALLPGVSRSGSTIAAGLGIGMSREDAARFSFLMSIPIITAAVMLVAADVASGEFTVTGAEAVGALVAAATGYLAIAGLLRLIWTRSFIPFAGYLVGASAVSAIVLSVR